MLFLVGTQNNIQTHQKQVVYDFHGEILYEQRQFAFSFCEDPCALIFILTDFIFGMFFKGNDTGQVKFICYKRRGPNINLRVMDIAV